MKRLMLAAVLVAALTLPATALAAGYTSPTWNLNGTYTIPFTETVGPDGPGPYPYSVVITTTSDTTGAVTGTGYFITGNGYPSVTIAGQVSGWDVTLNLTYDDPNLASYNPFVLTGAIDQYGGMAGTATDGQNREFTWTTTSGSVSLFSPRCDYGTYSGFTQVWTGFVSAVGTGTITPVVSTPATTPGVVYKLEASGTYFAGGTGLFDIQADAKYTQDAIQRAADQAWTDSVNLYGSYGPQLLDLLVDGAIAPWGAYSSAHRYAMSLPATGSPVTLALNINDIYADNNTGGLCVALYQGFSFAGFYAPVDNPPTVNQAKAGSAIPVKFSLGGDQGLSIFAAGFPQSTKIACDTSALLDDVTATVTAGGSSLSYDPLTGQYTYVWKTDKSWSGTCRQLVVTLLDGSTHLATFKFK